MFLASINRQQLIGHIEMDLGINHRHSLFLPPKPSFEKFSISMFTMKIKILCMADNDKLVVGGVRRKVCLS